MHPEAGLGCTDCHGGDATARRKVDAHVPASGSALADERVAARDADLAWRRFVNPMDLRVAETTCGGCHASLVASLAVSLHGTTAGHLSDGFYEMGLSPERGGRFGVFPVTAGVVPEKGGTVERLAQVPDFRPDRARERLATHYPDLVRKECMQCHLWSQGHAVRGRVGFDGDYRGEGCAACHVTYATSGLTGSADSSIPKHEPGHPLRHEMTRAPATSSCTSCHQGDASIGLDFRGLAQLPPGAPGGPEIPGTTDSLLHRRFHLDDPAMVPADVHHERGMHCIDCHTLSDVMGDGRLHGQMEHAVEITCQSCHGTFEEPATLETERGTPLAHLRREGGRVVLVSKVTGAEHEVPQVVEVLDPTSPRYNAEAARAMTSEHDGVECYTCHAGWNPNFLGFHFYRNEALSQLDLLSGARTPGRVTTQEKVFATWKSFYAGLNEAGRVAPYQTGFATLGSVDDARGVRIVDQELPETAAGLSGLGMIHHQPHTIRPAARSCVECHRTSRTWGMGSGDYRLARQLAFVADRRGIEVVAIERGQLSASVPVARFVLPDVVDLALDCDPVHGTARWVFACEGGRGVHVLDASDPTRLRRVAFVASVNPRALAVGGGRLYLADGEGGLGIYDVSEPERIERIAVVPMFDASDVVLRWPYAYVADGPGGLAIVDVREGSGPRYVGGIASARAPGAKSAAVAVDVLFQYSRPLRAGSDAEARSPARNLCALLDEVEGLSLVDVTEPEAPRLLHPQGEPRTRGVRAEQTLEYRALALGTHVDLATTGGGEPTAERDYVYVLEELGLGGGRSRSTLEVLDVSDPAAARRVARRPVGASSEMLVPASIYSPPFLQRVMLVAGSDGVSATDVSTSKAPDSLGGLGPLGACWAVALEEFPFDRSIDERGRRLKDTSHEGSRWLHAGEIDRILSVSAKKLGTERPGAEPPPPWAAARALFSQLDTDGDGLWIGVPPGGPDADADGDGVVTLFELAQLAPLESTTLAAPPPAAENPFEDGRGDLARLLDGTDPHEFDTNGDGRLDRQEASRATFAALDLDGDSRLGRDELSRYPGELRRLRYGPRIDRADLGPLARRPSVALKEWAGSGTWAALDVDGDGYVRLARRDHRSQGERDLDAAPAEWPTRRSDASGLPPGATAELLLATFDRDGDGALSRRELWGRPDLWVELDRDEDGSVETDELAQRVAVLAASGAELCPDAFGARWDLDGDGTVEPGELPSRVRALLEARGR